MENAVYSTRYLRKCKADGFKSLSEKSLLIFVKVYRSMVSMNPSPCDNANAKDK
jgi:hypothetical protein